MRRAVLSLVAIVFASSISFAQLSIENPKHLNIPEDQARLLLRMSCRAVAHELHLRESSISEFDMHLVRGEKDEGFGYDRPTGVPMLFLREWDEKKFVTAALRFAVQRSIDQHRQEELIADILHRHQNLGPIPADHLHMTFVECTDKSRDSNKSFSHRLGPKVHSHGLFGIGTP